MLAFAALADAPIADDTTILYLDIPAASIAIAGAAPVVSTGVLLTSPAANINIAASVPLISSGVSVFSPATGLTIGTRLPTISLGDEKGE